MKNGINSLLLGAISSILAYNVFFQNEHNTATITPVAVEYTQTDNTIPTKEASDDERLQQMLEVVKNPSRNLFKFPEAVIFSGIKYSHKEIFADADIDTEKDIDIITMCGYLSARNGMNAYGKKERFYAKGQFNHIDKLVGVQSMLMVDGELKDLSSPIDSYPLSGDQEKFDDNWAILCGDPKKVSLGAFNTYKTESYTYYKYDYLMEQLAEAPFTDEQKSVYTQCSNTTKDIFLCMDVASCIGETEDPREQRSCRTYQKVCPADADFGQCIQTIKQLNNPDSEQHTETVLALVDITITQDSIKAPAKKCIADGNNPTQCLNVASCQDLMIEGDKWCENILVYCPVGTLTTACINNYISQYQTQAEIDKFLEEPSKFFVNKDTTNIAVQCVKETNSLELCKKIAQCQYFTAMDINTESICPIEAVACPIGKDFKSCVANIKIKF